MRGAEYCTNMCWNTRRTCSKITFPLLTNDIVVSWRSRRRPRGEKIMLHVRHAFLSRYFCCTVHDNNGAGSYQIWGCNDNVSVQMQTFHCILLLLNGSYKFSFRMIRPHCTTCTKWSNSIRLKIVRSYIKRSRFPVNVCRHRSLSPYWGKDGKSVFPWGITELIATSKNTYTDDQQSN